MRVLLWVFSTLIFIKFIHLKSTIKAHTNVHNRHIFVRVFNLLTY